VKRLKERWRWLRHDFEVWWLNHAPPVVSRAPRWLKRLFLVDLAVTATRSELIGPDAYAGPDGIDYERMWWAIDGKLPPGREDEIRAPITS
jgi:hypothetical protein